MNSNDPTAMPASEALAALEAWIEGMHGAGGYAGPSVGLRGVSMSWCGPSHDWRWEGLLDGWISRHQRTRDPVYLDRIEEAFRELRCAQLADGSFRNSSFDLNPLEGGMPHEPIVVAALLRAGRHLRDAGRAWPDGSASMVERFVEERLIKSLWNKTLRTFNNWLQSDFEVFSPPAVAAAVETLIEYGELAGTTERWTPYIAGAADSLLKIQLPDGLLAGALPATSTDRDAASPFLASRCLCALTLLHRMTGDRRFEESARALAAFVRGAFQDSGGLACTLFEYRPHRVAPLFSGATASALSALARAGRLDDALWGRQLHWLMGLQSHSGGFDTAVGFGQGLPRRTPPDWRDALPVCGWAAAVYALLACRAASAAPGTKGSGRVCREVLVRGRSAVLTEDANALAIRRRGEPLFVWRKRTDWAEVCHL